MSVVAHELCKESLAENSTKFDSVCLHVCVYSEQDELMRQVEASFSEQERKELQREQERLLLKMERKGEQISKLYKHKTQVGSYTKTSSDHVQPHCKSKNKFCDECPLSFFVSCLGKEIKKGGEFSTK